MISRTNIFLIGPMGSGKTAVGKTLAKSLQLAFVDSDAEIERRTGVDIAFIFEKEGEAGFRQRERDIDLKPHAQGTAGFDQDLGLAGDRHGGANPKGSPAVDQRRDRAIHAGCDVDDLGSSRNSRHAAFRYHRPV